MAPAAYGAGCAIPSLAPAPPPAPSHHAMAKPQGHRGRKPAPRPRRAATPPGADDAYVRGILAGLLRDDGTAREPPGATPGAVPGASWDALTASDAPPSHFDVSAFAFDTGDD
jgi:hypothetical protein